MESGVPAPEMEMESGVSAPEMDSKRRAGTAPPSSPTGA
jgi:hypothetical protein